MCGELDYAVDSVYDVGTYARALRAYQCRSKYMDGMICEEVNPSLLGIAFLGSG